MPGNLIRPAALLVLCVAAVAATFLYLAYRLPVSGAWAIPWLLVSLLPVVALRLATSDRTITRIWLVGAGIALLALVAQVAAAFIQLEEVWVVGSAAILALPTMLVLAVGARVYHAELWRLRHGAPVVGALVLLVAATSGMVAWDRVTLEGLAPTRLEFMAVHAGCYRVDFGEWWPRQTRASAYSPPESRFVRLDTTRGPDTASGRRHWERGQPLVRPGQVIGSATWVPHDQHRATLRWNDGFTSKFATLRRTASGYRGRAHYSTDWITGGPIKQTTVRATPVNCALVPIDSARMPGAVDRLMRRNKMM